MNEEGFSDVVAGILASQTASEPSTAKISWDRNLRVAAHCGRLSGWLEAALHVRQDA